MHIHVLGSGAGGGFPQWNCNCRNCDGLRKGTLKARARTQSSICVSGDGVNWVLFNASPDVLQQFQDFPPLQPARAIRDTGLAGIILAEGAYFLCGAAVFIPVFIAGALVSAALFKRRPLSQKEIDAGVLRSVTLAQIDEIKPRRLASVVDEWKKLTKSDAPPILAVTIVYNDYLAKNQEPVAKFIAATRNALQFGSKNKGRVAEILQKAANMNATDARAYANQWDGAYIASFESADINSLKKMYEIVKAAGGATKDPPESAFDTGPYLRAKTLK